MERRPNWNNADTLANQARLDEAKELGRIICPQTLRDIAEYLRKEPTDELGDRYGSYHAKVLWCADQIDKYADAFAARESMKFRSQLACSIRNANVVEGFKQGIFCAVAILTLGFCRPKTFLQRIEEDTDWDERRLGADERYVRKSGIKRGPHK